MGEVRVRNLGDEVVYQLKERAKREGTSVEALLREFITREALRPRREFVAELRAHQEEMREKYGVLPDSTPGIRAERDGIKE